MSKTDSQTGNPINPAQLRAALALARAMIPTGSRLPGADLRTVQATEHLAQEMISAGRAAFRQLVLLLDWAAVLRTGRRFHKLDESAQERLIRQWEQALVMRWPLFVLGGLLKSAHLEHETIYDAYGVEFKKGGPPEAVRWLQQVQSGEEWEDDEALECDVVVVGTGPGGAIVGKELAEQGHAVVFVEEGSLYRRDAFTGSAMEAHAKFYRQQGKVTTLGNTAVPVLMGRLVGGSTTINTGTSFRTPPWILDEWCERLQTDELTPDRMKPHFDRVERQLQIGPNEDKYIGPFGQVVARGCERLGWSHFKVPRNAPDCDGQGVCDFGCPSGARLSMDVTYLPKAFARGAMLFTETKATRVMIENGRAVGIVAHSVEKRRPIAIRAQAVVLAGGAVPTPLLLLGQRLCNTSGQVGKNLSIHPGAAASALFDDTLEVYKHIPQGVGCDQFHRDDILLLGANPALNISAQFFPFYGQRLTEAMDALHRMGSMGVLVKDATQNGRVRLGYNGEPLITYWLQRADLEKMHQGIVHILELFRAAGARRVYPLGHRMPIIETDADLDKFRRWRTSPSDFIWTAFHPLGTVRMGKDPRKSVVDFNHETHDVRGLYIVDGSTVPGPTAVNPQLTIMAMADRAAGRIAERLE